MATVRGRAARCCSCVVVLRAALHSSSCSFSVMSPFRFTHAIVCRIPDSYKSSAVGISGSIDIAKVSFWGAGAVRCVTASGGAPSSFRQCSDSRLLLHQSWLSVQHLKIESSLHGMVEIPLVCGCGVLCHQRSPNILSRQCYEWWRLFSYTRKYKMLLLL